MIMTMCGFTGVIRMEELGGVNGCSVVVRVSGDNYAGVV